MHMACMYVCTYVRTYICMHTYVRVHVRMHSLYQFSDTLCVYDTLATLSNKARNMLINQSKLSYNMFASRLLIKLSIGLN